jgi:hypothetical protein
LSRSGLDDLHRPRVLPLGVPTHAHMLDASFGQVIVGYELPLGPLPQVRRHRSNVLQLLYDSLNDLAHFLLRDAKHFGDLAGRHSLVDEERENDLLPLLER